MGTRTFQQRRLNTAIFAGVCIAYALLFISCGGGGGPLIPVSTPGVTISTASVTFGSQAVGTTSAAQSVSVTNSGNASLNIASILVTGPNAADFSLTNTCGSSVAPGANCTASLTFTPSATGIRTASVSITDNASGSPQTVSLSGTGTGPVVSLSPTSLTFGSQTVGTSGTPQTITLSNTGNGALSITSVTVTGTNAKDFSETNDCGSSVAAGGNCTISVTFTPSASGSRTASVSITDNASGSPQAVSLSGTGGTFVLPVKASSNGRYLVDQNNNPWLLMGDSPQAMICTIDAADMATYMSARQSEGFNALDVDAICTTYTGGNSNGTAFDRTQPFTSGSSPSNYDLSTPNSSYFTELDSLINLASSYGFVVLLDPIETGGWLGCLEKNGATNAYNYGAYLGNRYKNFTNIVWFSGNDFQTWSSSSTDNNLVKQVMAGIASADSNHLQTIELNYHFSYSNQDTALASYLGADGVYTYYETYDCVLQAYASSPTIPAYLAEANYEGENNQGWLPAVAGTYVLREQAYWTLTSGGVGQIYGDHYTWGFISGWQSNLSTPGALEIQYINKLFGSVAWWDLVPDTTHEIVTAGYGTYDGSNGNLTTATYCTTSWISSGSLALTYCPNASTLTVDLAKFSGPVTAQWYDPSNGAYSAISGSPFPNSGTQDFITPGNNHDGDPDWVLMMSAPPGT